MCNIDVMFENSSVLIYNDYLFIHSSLLFFSFTFFLFFQQGAGVIYKIAFGTLTTTTYLTLAQLGSTTSTTINQLPMAMVANAAMTTFYVAVRNEKMTTTMTPRRGLGQGRSG